jgi:2-dehydropantoate 2-reductase
LVPGDLRSMRVAVIGAGAVGLGIGSALSNRGVEVHYVVNSEAQRRAMAEVGVTRTGIFGDIQIPGTRFTVSDSLESLGDDVADHWLICTKSTTSLALAEDLAPIWHATLQDPARALPPSIILCQNGWGNAEIFSRKIPPEAIFNAVVITGFERADMSTVRITVHANPIRIGSLQGVDLRSIEPLCRAISEGGVPCETSLEIARDLWAKVLYNALLNPLGALIGVPYGALGDRPQTRAIMQAIARETFSVMHAAGFETHWSSADDYLETFYAELLPPTAGHQSSMLLDLQAGRRTEIDRLSGAIANLGAAHGVQAPVNRAMFELIRGSEQRDSPADSPTNTPTNTPT